MTTSLLRVLFASNLLVLQAGGSTGVPPLFADVRIVGGPNITCGRVEVLSSTAVWGTVCDDLWDDLDAFVICRQLGFSGGKAFRNAFFGPGTGPIHLDDVRCTGFEPTINMCPYTSDTTSLPINCQHNEDASVCCDQPGLGLMHPVTTTPAPLQIHYDVCPMRPGRPPVPPQNIRLVGSIPGVGYVQTRAPNNTWGYVCDDYFGLDTATVVCRELCYDWIHARPSMHQQFYVKVTNPDFILDDVVCNGSEAQLQDCNHRPFFQHNCDSTEIAAVTCIPDTQLQCTNCFSPPPDLHCRNEDMIVIFNLTETPDLEAKHISFVNMGNTCSVSSYTVDNLITVIIRYDECGTDIKQNATHLIYFNTMIIMYTSQFEDITDRNDFRLELSCAIPRNYSSSNIVVPETVIVQQSSTMYLNVTVSFTKDDRFGTIVTTVPYPVVLGCWLNVTVNLHTNDPRMKLIVTDCRASPEYQQPVVPSHPLITDKCPAYPGLRMVPLTLSRFGFMYPVFGFVNHTNIVIECDALVCLTTDNTAECDQSCNSNNKTNIRGRRSSPFAKQSKKAKSPPFFVTGEDGHPLDQQYSNHSKVGFIIEKIALPNVVSEAKTTPEAKSTPEAKTTPKVRPTNSGVHQTTSVLSSSQHHATDVLHDESKNGTEIHPKGPVLIAPKSVDRVLVDNGCTLCLSPLLFTSVVVFSYYVHIF